MLKTICILLFTIIISIQLFIILNLQKEKALLIAYTPSKIIPILPNINQNNLEFILEKNTTRLLRDNIVSMSNNKIEEETLIRTLIDLKVSSEKEIIQEFIEKEQQNFRKKLLKEANIYTNPDTKTESFFEKYPEEKLKFLNMNLKLNLLRLNDKSVNEYKTALDDIIKKKVDFEILKDEETKERTFSYYNSKKLKLKKSYDDFIETLNNNLKEKQNKSEEQMKIIKSQLLENLDNENLEKIETSNKLLKFINYFYNNDFSIKQNEKFGKIKIFSTTMIPNSFTEISNSKKSIFFLNYVFYVKDGIGINLKQKEVNKN